MALRLARTNAEAHLYIELHPCEACGETEFNPASSVIEADGDLASRYAGPCPRCGTPREFLFRIPEEIILPDLDEPVFGDERPSVLIDAGEWLWLADLIARSTPAQPEAGMTALDRRQARVDLRTAAAAVGEAAKFVPADGDAVPAEAIWSSRGQAVYHDEPGRFRRRRLDVVQQTYRRLADRFSDPPRRSARASTGR
jgi:hypothetical protein